MKPTQAIPLKSRMRKSKRTIADYLTLWMLRHMKAAQVDGIRIVDVRKQGDSFEQTIVQALQLIRDHDPRRYKRVTRHINWIVNEFTHSQGPEYNGRISVCSIEFSEPKGVAPESLVALYACALIHEATHGVIHSRQIPYDAEKRSHIERLCVTEQNRFAARLAQVDPVLYPRLHMAFDEGDWQFAWTAGRLKKALVLLSRARKNWNPGPSAASNGSSTKPVADDTVPPATSP